MQISKRDSVTDNLNHKSIRVEVAVRTETTIREIIRIDTDQITDQIAHTEDNIDKDRSRSRYEQNFRRGNTYAGFSFC